MQRSFLCCYSSVILCNKQSIATNSHFTFQCVDCWPLHLGSYTCDSVVMIVYKKGNSQVKEELRILSLNRIKEKQENK